MDKHLLIKNQKEKVFFFGNRIICKRNFNSVTEQGKLNREPQLFLPVRPNKLFSPCDIHKQNLQTNGYNVSSHIPLIYIF